MTTDAQTLPPFPPTTVVPTVNAVSDGFRVAIYAPRGPWMYLGPRVLLWSGANAWTAETSPFFAWEFGSEADALEAAREVLATFEWATPAARNRIVEVIDASGTVVAKAAFNANGVGAVRLV